MKTYVEIIGPCSKWVQDKGWTTQIPEELIIAQGYKKIEKGQIVISESMYLDMSKTISELSNKVRRETLVNNPNRFVDPFKVNKGEYLGINKKKNREKGDNP